MNATLQAIHGRDDALYRCDGEDVKNLLLIEDDPLQAAAMQRWLEALGNVAVTVADTGYTAEAHLKSDVEWGTVVTDIDLPGMNGLEILELCKGYHPRTPVMLVTAHRRFDYAVDALRGEADDLLVKPVDRDQLQIRVRSLLANYDLNPEVRTARRVLAIGAHPDDVEIGCAGALLNHAVKGDRVTILTLTGGEAGGRAELRAIEAREAADRIGAELRLLNLPDRELTAGADTISAIEHVIADFDPDIIYTHSLHDAHQDHRAVHRATIVAARGIPTLYCYQAPSATVDFRPNHFENIARQLPMKLELMQLYATQVGKRPYMSDAQITANAEYWGRFADYKLVEPFEVVRRSA
ncbi:MAG: PIG-L family deacetylase [Gemmatimonadota bacterium]